MSGAPVPELKVLTGVRGIAAWLVVLFHMRVAAGTTFPDWLQAALAKGYLAVDFFFMLSGFVLWLSYQDKLRAGGLAAAPRFLARRIARIWPLHAVILAGGMAFALLLTVRGTPDPVEYPWAELPLHLLLVHNWGFTDALTWNDPSWSISCELAAYLLFPLLVLAVDWRRFHPALLIAGIGGLALLLGALFDWIGAASLNHDIPRMGIVRALVEFTMGTMVCALAFGPGRKWPMAGLLAGAAAALAVAGAHEAYFVPLLFAGLLMALVQLGDRPANPLCSPVVHYLGRISYSTYLVHYLLFVAFKLPLESAENIPLWQVGLYLAMTLAASIALYHLVEAPGQKQLNRRFDQWLERWHHQVRPRRPA